MNLVTDAAQNQRGEALINIAALVHCTRHPVSGLPVGLSTNLRA
jgi:hypothetical protein